MANLFSRHAHDVFETGFYSEDFDFEVRIQLGQAPYGGADVGEVLRTIAEVKDGDHEGWYQAWSALGERLATQAAASADAGHRASAAAAYLRAANAYSPAVNAAAALGDEELLQHTFRAHRAAWDAFVDRAPYPAERLAIPYENTTMPGYFFRASTDGGKAPTLILVNGSDGSISSMWATGGLGGLHRGYNVLMFDGPGQQSMLFDKGIPFRYDWEAVMRPVVDVLVGRDDVMPTVSWPTASARPGTGSPGPSRSSTGSPRPWQTPESSTYRSPGAPASRSPRWNSSRRARKRSSTAGWRWPCATRSPSRACGTSAPSRSAKTARTTPWSRCCATGSSPTMPQRSPRRC